MCPKCRLVAHRGISCTENTRRIEEDNMRQAGVRFIQRCPRESCRKPWDLPIECLHVTCEGNEGCGQQFCFLCSASYTPTTIHGAWYHRPECPSYCHICDCVQDPIVHGTGCNTVSCIKAGISSSTCTKSKYWPGPCVACLTAKSNNTCTHGAWRACNSCVSGNKICKHWCYDCREKGSLCVPPGNPADETTETGLKYKVSNHFYAIFSAVVLFTVDNGWFRRYTVGKKSLRRLQHSVALPASISEHAHRSDAFAGPP
jgi:hypothetical protein